MNDLIVLCAKPEDAKCPHCGALLQVEHNEDIYGVQHDGEADLQCPSCDEAIHVKVEIRRLVTITKI